MKIIGAGFGRTGTSSLKQALLTLGFGPCLHMDDVVAQPALGELWADALDADDSSLDRALVKLLDGYGSAVDWPACSFWSSAIGLFPDARVILTTRDVDTWVRSFSETLAPLWAEAMTKSREASDMDMPHANYYRLAAKLAYEEFNGNVFDEQHLKSRFLEHISQVETTVPSSRLLIYRVTDGWGPLCNFLDCDVPDVAFPVSNDRQTFKANASRVFSG